MIHGSVSDVVPNTWQEHIAGTSELHLCSRRTSKRNSTHCRKPLVVDQQRHVANREGKSGFFPWSSYFMQEKKQMEAQWEWTCSGATLRHIFKIDFTLREKGLNRTKFLQAKLPTGFNYFRGLNCSQMSLWGRQSPLQKAGSWGPVPLQTMLDQLQQLKLDDWSCRLAGHSVLMAAYLPEGIQHFPPWPWMTYI